MNLYGWLSIAFILAIGYAVGARYPSAVPYVGVS